MKKWQRPLTSALPKSKKTREGQEKRGAAERPMWPMIILETPKGWTGPKIVDGNAIEGTFRAHQVPISMEKEEHLAQLEEWLRSYRPEELFGEDYRLIPELRELAPVGDARMSANPHTNGGKLLRDLRVPDFKDYAVEVPYPGSVKAQDMMELGGYVRDILKLNKEHKNFRFWAGRGEIQSSVPGF